MNERAKRRRKNFDQLHGEVLAGKTIRDLYVVYATNRFKGETEIGIDDEDVTETIKHAFYAGAASMLEMMQRVGPEDVSEEVGVEMLTRLAEELESFSREGH